jgi:pimeloyl-ACP methyl ester carboxylesterase
VTEQTRNWVRCLLFTVVSGFVASAARADSSPSDVYFNVSVRSTGSATIHGKVFNNPASHSGITVLALHGFTEAADVWGPLSNAMFSDRVLKLVIRRVVALDMIGHGESSTPTNLPSGVTFGTLTIDDNDSVIIQSIDALRTQGLGASVIMGHSMGGLEIQGVQESLLAHNSSLSAHGIVSAILVAAVPANGLQWTRLSAPADLTPFLVNDPVLGQYLSLPAAVAQQAGAWTTLSGTLVPNAPTPAQIQANDYNDIEPIVTALQLNSNQPVPRPSVRQGAFALRNGTVLAVISFSQDVLAPAVDQQAMYTYLLGRSGALYSPIVASDAVHSMYISNPTGLLQALRNMF